jgi:holo-[acyl-carrier protein] synthase
VRFPERILHPDERAEYANSKQKAAFLAKRFAAKEALAKALGTGIARGVQFHDFVIYKDPLGRPQVKLFSVAKQFADAAGISNIQLSITDERQYAMAFAILA